MLNTKPPPHFSSLRNLAFIIALMYTVLFSIWFWFGDVPHIKSSYRFENVGFSIFHYFLGILIILLTFLACHAFREYAKGSKIESYLLFNWGISWAPAYVFVLIILEAAGLEVPGTIGVYFLVFPGLVITFIGGAIANRPLFEKPILLTLLFIGVALQYFALGVFMFMVSGMKGIQ